MFDFCVAEASEYLPDRAKTEAETMMYSGGRGSKVETEARLTVVSVQFASLLQAS